MNNVCVSKVERHDYVDKHTIIIDLNDESKNKRYYITDENVHNCLPVCLQYKSTTNYRTIFHIFNKYADKVVNEQNFIKMLKVNFNFRKAYGRGIMQKFIETIGAENVMFHLCIFGDINNIVHYLHDIANDDSEIDNWPMMNIKEFMKNKTYQDLLLNKNAIYSYCFNCDHYNDFIDPLTLALIFNNINVAKFFLSQRQKAINGISVINNIFKEPFEFYKSENGFDMSANDNLIEFRDNSIFRELSRELMNELNDAPARRFSMLSFLTHEEKTKTDIIMEFIDNMNI